MDSYVRNHSANFPCVYASTSNFTIFFGFCHYKFCFHYKKTKKIVTETQEYSFFYVCVLDIFMDTVVGHIYGHCTL